MAKPTGRSRQVFGYRHRRVPRLPHSTRSARTIIQYKWLQGSELFIKPAFPIPGWTSISPGIGGLPNWTDEQAIKFLTNGIAPDGAQAFNRAHAQAVVAYLRSLKTHASTLEPHKKQTLPVIVISAGGKQRAPPGREHRHFSAATVGRL